MLLAVMLACLAVQLAVPLATLPHRVSWDYGEGWNAYWAARAMAGLPLYTDRLSPISDNYPPLSFYLVGIVGRLVGDQVIAGRLVSLVSLLACAAIIGRLVARLRAGRRWAVASALGFLLYVGGFAWRYVASDDPQWLAAAVTLTALLLLARPDRGIPTTSQIIGASALLVVAGLIKHNELAAPLAVTIWLFRGRRHRLAWLAAGALFGGTALALIRGLFGPLALDQIVHHERILKLRYFPNALETVSGLLPEVGLGWLLWRERKERPAEPAIDLLLLFGAIALVLGMAERFGTGVSVNAHFDAAIGFFVLGGLALGRCSFSPAVRWRMSLVALIPLVASTLVMMPRTVARLATIDRTERQWHDTIATIRAAPGPVACELPALCYWAGRPFLMDFFNYGQKLRIQGDPAHLGDAIRRRRFAAMLVVRDRRYLLGDGRLPPGLDRAIERGYRPVRYLPDHIMLLVPRTSGVRPVPSAAEIIGSAR